MHAGWVVVNMYDIKWYHDIDINYTKYQHLQKCQRQV